MDQEDIDSLRHDSIDSDLTTTFCREFGVNRDTAIEMLAFFDDHYAPDVDSSATKTIAIFRQAISHLILYQQKQTTVRELRMSTRAIALALGFIHQADAESAQDLGFKLGIDKQTVNKCLNTFIRKIGLSKLSWQRSNVARKKMAYSRNKQLRYETKQPQKEKE